MVWRTRWSNIGGLPVAVIFNIVPDNVMAKLRTVDGGIEWVDGKRLKDLDDSCLFVKEPDAVNRTNLASESTLKSQK